MRTVVFHGSPRKGNTYKATSVFLDELSRLGADSINLTEFFLPKDLPEFCIGCQLCLSGPNEKCPHYQYVKPILETILSADALVFTTPHFGACDMSGVMKNLFDHLDFLTMNIAPREEVFRKKAFIITTGSGSSAAIKPIKRFIKNWGINRVHSLGIRMFTDKWDKMPAAKRVRYEKALRHAALRFHCLRKKRPYITTIFMYYVFKIVIKKYIGKGNYPYEYWNEQGYLTKRPF